MNEAEKNQIDEFLADLAEENLDEAKLESFEELLLERADLQDYYVTRLGHQLLLLNQLKYFQPELECFAGDIEPCAAMVPGLTSDLVQLGEVEPAQLATPRNARQHAARFDWRYVLGLACSFMLGAVVAIWGSRAERQFASQDGSAVDSTPTPIPMTPVEPALPEVTANGLKVSNTRSLNLVSDITHTEAIESLELPCDPELTGSVYKPCTGTAFLHRRGDKPERGYLIALEPGRQMDVYIDTTAHDQNALSVVELDERGELAGGWTTFDNLYEKNADLPVRRLGKIGYLSEFNPSKKTKYFLFIGSHMLAGQSIDRRWYQSDFRVRLASDNVTVVGWDDTGIAKYDGPIPVDYEPDYDFNDVMMTVHFTSPESSDDSPTAGELTLLPTPREDEEFSEAEETGCALQVSPGHELILSAACNSSGTMNSIQIVELPSKRVLWKKSNEPDESGVKPEGDFGVYAIKNETDEAIRYEIQSFHRKANQGDWLPSPYRVFAAGNNHVLFGFEDHPGDPIHHNNEDVNVIGRLLKLD